MRKISKIINLIKHFREIGFAITTQLSLLEGNGSFALGGLTDEEDDAIARLTKQALDYNGPIIEFGTLFGITTKLITSSAAGRQKVFSIDNFSWNPFGLTPVWHETFVRKILRFELESGKLELLVSDSNSFRNSFTGQRPSMVFFDADHTFHAVKEEILWAKSLRVPLICGHDYNNDDFGVTQAVNEEFPDGVETAGMVWWKEISSDK